jgi:hypothetical protein
MSAVLTWVVVVAAAALELALSRIQLCVHFHLVTTMIPWLCQELFLLAAA